MSVLMWEKPKPIMSKEERASYQADGAPPGTWMPNMSREDEMRWKAKFVGKTTGFPQVELRRNGMVVILSKRGYKYQRYDCRQTPENLADYAEKKKQYKWDDELDNVVHIASSGSQAMNMQEYQDFTNALKEGWEALEELDK
jgi:hypothetical protein